MVHKVTSTSEHDTPKLGTEDTPDTPDPEPGTPTTPEPDRSEPGTVDPPEHGTPDTPDPEPGTPTTPEPKLGKRKKLFKDFRSMLSLGISTSPEPVTPEPGAPTTPEPHRPKYGKPTTLEPGTPDTPEQEGNKTKPKLGKRKKLFKDFRSMLLLGISTTPEPDTPEPGAPTTPEPGTPELEDNKTKSRLGKRKKLFKAFRSMLLPGISTTPEPDTPVPGRPTFPEPDTPESVTPTNPEPGTPDTVELKRVDSKEDKIIEKNGQRKSKMRKVRNPQNFLYVMY